MVYNNVTILKFLWKKVNKVAYREGTCRGLSRSYHQVLFLFRKFLLCEGGDGFIYGS